MALDVIVRISQTATAGKVGFGVPLILTTKATAQTAVPFTLCNSLEAVKTACGANSEAVKAAALIFAQTNKPQQIAVYSTTAAGTSAIAEVISKEWRQLILIRGEGDTVTDVAVATYIEETNKLFFTTIAATAALENLKTFSRTVAFFYNLVKDEAPVQPYAAAALVGETAGRSVGSFTYKNLIIKGLEPLDLSDNELGEIHNGGALTIVVKAGDIVTTEGKTCSGEYIDAIDGKDWIVQKITLNAQKLLNNEPKLPYTNAGIASLESVTESVLKEAYDRGIIAEADDGTPRFSVSFKNRSEMSAENIRNRTYTGGNFFFALADAIHDAEINGELII